ncbi:hypothetical protein EHI2019_000654500 [Entamoeba histolytica]
MALKFVVFPALEKDLEEKGKIIKETEYSITYEINTYRREIKIKYNGEEIEGKWKLISTRTITENKRNINQSDCVVM